MKQTTLLLMLLTSTFAISLAQTGTLDPSFGNNGVVTTSIGVLDDAIDMITREDGKILVLGMITDGTPNNVSLTQYLPDGTIDPDFGINGTANTTLNLPSDFLFTRLFIQDQKIIISGKANTTAVLLRFNSNGVRDMDYGNSNDGMLLLTAPTPTLNTDIFPIVYHLIDDVLIQSDGKIIIVHHSERSFLITRFNPNGTPDLTYANEGTVTTATSSNRYSDRYVAKALLTPNDTVIIVGTRYGASISIALQFYDIVYYDNNGTYAGGFFEINDFIFSENAELDKDSNLFISTTSDAIIKLDNTTALDNAFGENGFVLDAPVDKLAIDNDNNLIVSSENVLTGETELKKYWSDGAQDLSFGTEGILTVPQNPVISTIKVLSDGALLISGTTRTSATGAAATDIILIKYQGEQEEPTVIEGFTLIDGTNETAISPLEDGQMVSIDSSTQQYLNIRAEVNAANEFKSMVLRLEGPVNFARIENQMPYAVFGDTNGNYFGKALPEGSYVLEATPFEEINAGGTAGESLTITFSVTHTINASVVPNPIQGERIAVHLEGNNLLGKTINYTLIDMMGRTLLDGSFSTSAQQDNVNIDVSGRLKEPGVYSLKIGKQIIPVMY